MSDLLELGLEIGSYFDYITPIAAWIQDRANEGGHTFLMPREYCPVVPIEIEWALEEQGINSWGLMIVGGTILISVHPDVAGLAQQVIESLGIWIEYGQVETGGGP